MAKDLVFENIISDERAVNIGRIMDEHPLDPSFKPGDEGFVREMDVDLNKLIVSTDRITIQHPPCIITTPFRVNALRRYNRAILTLDKNILKITLKFGKRIEPPQPTREVVCTLRLEDFQRKQLLKLHARYLEVYDETIKPYYKKAQTKPQQYSFNSIKAFLPYAKDKTNRRWTQLPARNISADLTAHYEQGAPNPYTLMTNRNTTLSLSSSIVKIKHKDLHITGVDGCVEISNINEPLPDSFESVVMQYAGSNFHLIFQVEDTSAA